MISIDPKTLTTLENYSLPRNFTKREIAVIELL